MKKLALTNLLIIFGVVAVNACSYTIELGTARATIVRQNYDAYFFFSSFILIIPIIVLYFLRRYKGLWTIIAGLSSLILFLPVLFFTALITQCSEGAGISLALKIEFTLMISLFTFQFSSWVSKTYLQIKPYRKNLE